MTMKSLVFLSCCDTMRKLDVMSRVGARLTRANKGCGGLLGGSADRVVNRLANQRLGSVR